MRLFNFNGLLAHRRQTEAPTANTHQPGKCALFRHRLVLGGAICFAVYSTELKSHAQTPASQAAPTTQGSQESPLVRDGKAALAAGRFKEARDLFLKAAEADPKDYAPLHGAGVAYLYLRDDQQASRVLGKAVILAPVADRALSYNYAVSDMNLKNYRRAAQTLRDYLYANPKVLDEPLADALGALLYQTGENNAASRVSDDSRKFYSVYVAMLEEKRPGLKKWGPKWLPAVEVDRKAARMREAETTISLLTQDAQAAQGNMEKNRISFREQQEKQAKLSAAKTVVDELRPDYPQLLLPIDMNAKTAPSFEVMMAVPTPSRSAPTLPTSPVAVSLTAKVEQLPPDQRPQKVTPPQAVADKAPAAINSPVTGMIGTYKNRNGAIPFLMLSVPNGDNVLSDSVKRSMMGKIDMDTAHFTFTSRGQIAIPGSANYRITGGRACSISIDGKKYDLSNYRQTNTAEIPLTAGVHEISLDVINNGGQLAEAQVRVVDLNGKEIPIQISMDEVAQLLKTPIDGAMPVELSGWKSPAVESPTSPPATQQPLPVPDISSTPAPASIAGIDANVLKQCQVAADGTISTEREVKLVFWGT